jgi:hypothetical protein
VTSAESAEPPRRSAMIPMKYSVSRRAASIRAALDSSSEAGRPTQAWTVPREVGRPTRAGGADPGERTADLSGSNPYPAGALT